MAKNELDNETSNELLSLSTEELKSKIVEAESSIKLVTEELEANPKYTVLKESLKDLTAGLREVKKRQKAIILRSLQILESRGAQ